MIKPLTMNFPMFAARFLAFLNISLGNSKKGVLGQGGYRPEEAFVDSPDTSEARFSYYREFRRANPCLQNTAATYLWARESFYVSDFLLNPERAQNVRTKVLLFQAENDTFVSNKAEERFAALLPNCLLVRMKGTKHEIYMSNNETMTDYVEQLLNFYNS